MPEQLDIKTVLELRKNRILVDVRSEGEYHYAHIPGAVNIPLLNNDARKEVGTIYKEQGHEAAVQKGFELAAPGFAALYEAFARLASQSELVFYCWRGGLRSQISATLFEWGKGRSNLLKGGYKAYRKAALGEFTKKLNLAVLSGFTGTGKTEILHLLASEGEQVIDIEGLANHKGSALGALGMPGQVSQEMFENLLADQWMLQNTSGPVYIENESRKIGANVLPEAVWEQLQNGRNFEITVPRPVRLQRILKEYGHFDPVDLAHCTRKIQKRLGGLNLKNALDALQNADTETWAGILMDYYDRTYLHSRKDKTDTPQIVEWNWNQSQQSVQALQQVVAKFLTAENKDNPIADH